MVELLYAFREEAKYPIPLLQPVAWERHGELVAAAESAQVVVIRHPKTQEPIHFGEPRPTATEVIQAEMGAAGEIAFRELSGVAHGNPTALIRQTKTVPDHLQPPGVPLTESKGVSLTRPTLSPRDVVPKLGVVWQVYVQALENKLDLFGWDRTSFSAWIVEARREMVRLLASDEETEG
jgi:hypothetical protein